MNTKSFLVAGLVGGIVDWLLGWLLYGIIFINMFPQPNEDSNAIIYITCGCIAFGFFISYIFNKWAQISTFTDGLNAGAIIGLFMGLITNFFRLSEQASVNYEMFFTDLGISIVLAAVVGAFVGLINGKIK